MEFVSLLLGSVIVTGVGGFTIFYAVPLWRFLFCLVLPFESIKPHDKSLRARYKFAVQIIKGTDRKQQRQTHISMIMNPFVSFY